MIHMTTSLFSVTFLSSIGIVLTRRPLRDGSPGLAGSPGSGHSPILLLANPKKRLRKGDIFLKKPGQVVNIPEGWWHWETALADQTHLLDIFDGPTPTVVFGSDVLRLTPHEVLAHTYCLDGEQLEKTVKPITNTVIGPPNNCKQPHRAAQPDAAHPVYRSWPKQKAPTIRLAGAPSMCT